jgi:ABC-2 type transport system permease protein
MASAFLRIRARPDEDEEINWHFENVNFLLNVIDELSGENTYVDIRMRKPMHATLRQIEEAAQFARNAEFAQKEAFQDKFDDELEALVEEKDKAMKKYEDRIEELKKNPDASMADRVAIEQQKQIEEQRINQKQEVTRQQLQQELSKQVEQIRRESDLGMLKIQNWYKFWAVVIPPIPPLLIGLIVFVHRRLREREGVTKTRLR